MSRAGVAGGGGGAVVMFVQLLTVANREGAVIRITLRNEGAEAFQPVRHYDRSFVD